MTAATNNIQQPNAKIIAKGPIGIGAGIMLVAKDIWLNLLFDGVPGSDQGKGWAGLGSTGIDETTGIAYVNMGTRDAPNWVESGGGGGSLPGYATVTDLVVGENTPSQSGENLYNTYLGANAGAANTTGNSNVAIGTDALEANQTGIYNTAVGDQAMQSANGGNQNTAVGGYAMPSVSGNQNTAIGESAGYDITTGSNNIAIGYDASLPDGTASNVAQIGNAAVEDLYVGTTHVVAGGVVQGGGYSFDAITTGASPVAANPTTNLTVVTSGGTAGTETIGLAIPSSPQDFVGFIKAIYLKTLTNGSDNPVIDPTNVVNVNGGEPAPPAFANLDTPNGTFLFQLGDSGGGSYKWVFIGQFDALDDVALFATQITSNPDTSGAAAADLRISAGPGRAVFISGGTPGGGGGAGDATISGAIAPLNSGFSGADVNITSGQGDDDTVGTLGGNINLNLSDGQAAVGLLNVNSVPDLIPVSYSWTAGALLNGQTIHTTNRNIRVTAVIGRIDAANGTAATLKVVKCASGTAPSGGTNLTTNTVNLAGTVATNQALTLSSTLLDINLVPGDSLCLVATGTLVASAGCITVWSTPQ